jgi:hypothetical protein
MEVEGIELAEGDARHFQMLDDGRLKCTLNGHVLPSNADALSSFVRYVVYPEQHLCIIESDASVCNVPRTTLK